MTLVVALVFSLLLCLIGAIHAYWGFGGRWPAQDERSLARMVVGSKDIERMPGKAACLLVAAMLFGIALWPQFLIGALPELWPHWLTAVAGAVIALAFFGRGIISYIPALRFLGPEEPFATLDRRFYAPLCLLLGLLVLLLLVRSW